ncbi:MAG: hypothetical protein M3Q80_01410 [bacterium]|nr:hypothetical protein [bacterium]
MIKFTSVAGIMMFAFGVFVSAVSAQTNSMPALYDESGGQVNESNSSLPAGYYFLDADAGTDSRVYYFGNGTYFDLSTGGYGGEASNASGQAGVESSAGVTMIPGVPNTGSGGQSPVLWLLLGLTGVLAITGMTYLASTQSSPRNIRNM